MLQLDAVETVALGGLALLGGYALCRAVPIFRRYNLPEPVVGGLVIALIVLFAHGQGTTLFELDTTLQTPLMVAFFTTLGVNASLALLRISGRQVGIFLAMATGFVVVQNLVGLGVASMFGLHPLFGVLVGSATMAGGPATGLAFAPLFEQAGLAGAESIAITSAMAGIVCGGIVGGPGATVIIRRWRLKTPGGHPTEVPDVTEAKVDPPQTEGQREFSALKSIIFIMVAMWLGGWIGMGFESLGLTLPAYIGAMLIGAVVRNIDDVTGWIGLPLRTIDLIGNICLALFLAVALMNLKLWELAGMALPLAVNMVLQVSIVVAFCVVVFRAMGKDYDAAVMGGGFIGFMLGTTANAMAVMRTLVQRYGMAPRAFLVAPLVGAFFIDFTNALVITGFMNFAR
ncbi:sodium/glutamate symporter [Lysobacter sp. A03]|uniref:sodium/glutamate symporter n=1 Tax=Lysobacter sp. A03 TaxID=1199154 RepID=UPI0005B6C3BD|nr:sodium/glutamate symporter [Lysobacter sp. A03]KIQ97513.1 Sodium/glutamate symporter [Lysobacter sp. A03]